MIPLITGLLSFLLFMWYDVLTVRCRPLRFGFLCIGSMVLAASTFWILWEAGIADRMNRFPTVTILWLIPAFLSLAGLIYALFFALPFAGTYTGTEKKGTVSSGLYGVCRHPGVWFLAGIYFFAALAVPHVLTFAAFALYTFSDVLYVIWQEHVIFPKTLSDYEAYREEIPFLLPSLKKRGNTAEPK